MPFRSLWRSFTERRARSREMRSLLRQRWESLPEAVRTDNQWAGRSGISCGATHGVMEKCNYSCTSCYLTDRADFAKPLPYEKVREQLVTLRSALGPGGKVQITSGEVTLLRVEDLGRLVSTALDLGLDPMVMSNGQRFFDEPEYLPTLVREYGLQKVCCHIDVTQPERVKSGDREADLDGYRDEYAELIRRTRCETGRPLHAAHTITVTPENLDGVEDVVAWALRNCDAVRMISFQPVAEVGRTRDARGPEASFDAVWSRVEKACGRRVNRRGMQFGHEDCNATVPVLVIDDRRGRPKVVDVIREGSRFDRTMLRHGLEAGVETEGHPLWIVGHALWAVLRKPHVFALGMVWALSRGVGLLPAIGRSLLRGRIPRLRPMMIVVHRFMSPDELETDRGRERLEACTFKLPLEDGSLVSMCEMNATELRRELTDAQVPERWLEPTRPVSSA